jgi:hypothetical protein
MDAGGAYEPTLFVGGRFMVIKPPITDPASISNCGAT